MLSCGHIMRMNYLCIWGMARDLPSQTTSIMYQAGGMRHIDLVRWYLRTFMPRV
jgi:hypothetical protein